MHVDNIRSQQTHRKGKCHTTSAWYRHWRHLRFPSISVDFTVLLWLLRTVSLRMQCNNSYPQCSTIPPNIHLSDGQLAFLLLTWSVLLKRLWSGAPRTPQSDGSKEKKANTGRFPGKSVLQGRNSDPTAVLHSIWRCRSCSLTVWSRLRQSSPKVIIWHSKYDVQFS